MWCVGFRLTTAVPRRYIVLPYYEQTLGAYMATFVDAGTLPPEREVLLLLTQLCQALVHLQRNHVVHHDIKVCVYALACDSPAPHTLASPLSFQSDNIFLGADGNAKMADFGEVSCSWESDAESYGGWGFLYD